MFWGSLDNFTGSFQRQGSFCFGWRWKKGEWEEGQKNDSCLF